MKKFDKPINLNGAELRNELRNAGVNISDDFNSIHIDGEGNFWLDISEEDAVKAAQVVVAHNGTVVAPEPTPADKLAAAGLTVDELKAVLGIN